MGARQRAQKRGKAPKGSLKGTPASQRKLNSSIHVADLSPTTRSHALMGWQDFELSSSPNARKGFTMGDAARNTERHSSGWGPSKLRGQAIAFVSAGTLHQDPENVQAQAEVVDKGMEREIQESLEKNEVQPTRDQTSPIPEVVLPPDTIKDDKGHNGKIRSTAGEFRERSLSSSSSEAEQIVFTGRSKGPTPNAASGNDSKMTSRAQSLARTVFTKQEPVISTKQFDITIAQPIPIAKQVVARPIIEATSSDRPSTKPRRRGRGGIGGRRRQDDIDEQEALMRDYIANMAMDDSDESENHPQQSPSQQQPHWSKARKNETFRFYDGAGEENVKVQIQSKRKGPGVGELDQAMDWNSDDLQDFDELSTTDEEVVEISQVLRYRERKSGPQYLVTPIGAGANDAKWMLHVKLDSVSAKNEIAIFEEIQAMELEEESYDEDEEDEDEDETTDEEAEEALNDLIDHIESEDDENARIMKHTAKMSDEQIARALAKQEELGMGGDELMLFSGDIDEDEKEINDDFGRNADFISFSLKSHTSNRTRSKRNKKGNRDTFPSAAAFVDALDEDPYGAFDVMDFERPSLRPKKKGRKSDFPYDLELEDDDLRDQLVSTWMKDRDKKATRKQEKEEARMAMLLEYANRGDPAAIKAEIRRFLLQEVDTLRLSPMESATRASVHRLAKALQLNSRSEGKDGTAKGRYPVLTKTHRTPSYTIDNIWEIDALLNTRKFFPKGSYRQEKLPRGTARTMRVRQSGGVSGASYMNGEIVGASAPELAADNKGRAMLEKMGWTSGMAIGAEGNKGSLEAVKHVFKTSRAGLG